MAFHSLTSLKPKPRSDPSLSLLYLIYQYQVCKPFIDDQPDSPEDDLNSDEDMMKMKRDM